MTYVRSAYEVYADHKSDKVPPMPTGGAAARIEDSGSIDLEPHVLEPIAKRFKDTFSRDVRVHFIGVWCAIFPLLLPYSAEHTNDRDTVSSIGIVREKNLPGTVSPDHVCYFRHALALDERRVKFLPEYARGGVGPNVTPPAGSNTAGNNIAQSEPRGTSLKPHIKETWFTGTRSDM